MINTYLSFIVCGELYAVNVTKVLEVLEKQNITRVPNAPDHIKGIINFRGDVVPVFESRKKFNLPARANDDSFVIIVLDLSQEGEMFRIGAIVDKVKDVISIDNQEVKPVPLMSKEFDTKFLEGIVKQDDNFIMLLDVEKVFTGDEINAIKETNIVEKQIIY
jgi:purine-binding chemotaxis protein CheW